MAELIVNAAVRNFPIAVGESRTVGRDKVADIALFGEHGPAGDDIHGVCYVLTALDTSWTVEVPVNKKPSVVVSNRSNPSEIHPPVRPGDGPRHFYLESAELALHHGWSSVPTRCFVQAQRPARCAPFGYLASLDSIRAGSTCRKVPSRDRRLSACARPARGAGAAAS